MVYVIENRADLIAKISEAGDKLIILDFYANWCGPCKIVGPKFEELSEMYQDHAVMLKINVDDCDDIAVEYNVSVMPTFVFIKNNEVVEFVVGANEANLTKHVEKHCGVESSPSRAMVSAISSEINGPISLSDSESMPPTIDETSAEYQAMDAIQQGQVNEN